MHGYIVGEYDIESGFSEWNRVSATDPRLVKITIP
jgi:hypothetical protein